MKKDLTLALVAILAVFGLAFALSAALPKRPATPSQPFSLEDTPAAGAMDVPGGMAAAGDGSEVGPNDKIVMRVNGVPVTEREFRMVMAEAPEQQRAFLDTPKGRLALAQQLIRLKALAQEGKRLGATNDPELASRIKFGLENAAASYAVQKLAAEPSDATLRAEYEKEKGNAVVLSHIAIAYAGGALPPKGGGQAMTPDQALQKANALVRQLRGGRDFASAAKAESDDPQSGQNGGVLGPLQPGALPPQLEQTVQGLKPGEVSEPVRSQYAIHIFRVGAIPFEAVKAQLAQKIRQEEMARKVEEVQAKAKVELEPWFFPERDLKATAPQLGQKPPA
ncbi:MAG: peptidylprolyl isomerase [Acidobacteria bacterium]|nr:peptidylprolyl isomerase [Acidobacteriota bacterium]